MYGRLKKKKVDTRIKVLIVVVVLSLIAAVYTTCMRTSLLSSAVGFVTTPLQSLSTAISNRTNPKNAGYNEILRENEELESELNELRREKAQNYDLKRENEQYRELLELKKANNDYKFASASVIGRDPMELFFGFTIDQGSLMDISLYDPVVTDKGLVGYISAVYPSYSKVASILSPEVSVSAVDKVTLDNGIINGSLEASKTKKAHMKYVSAQNKMKTGDIVTTSGMGGLYPAGLLIGEVESIIREENSMDMTITVLPYEDIENLSSVFIITNFEGQGALGAQP